MGGAGHGENHASKMVEEKDMRSQTHVRVRVRVTDKDQKCSRTVKNLPAMQDIQVGKTPLEKGMAAHSSILA